MTELIEVKRKMFEVETPLGARSYKVKRGDYYYFLKKFDNDEDGFFEYVYGFDKLKVSGVKVPKIYVYDKQKMLVVTDYIEGETVLETLMKQDLPDEYFEAILQTNFYAKNDRLSISWMPDNFKYYNGKMWYLPMKVKKGDPKLTFENKGMFYWAYTKELVSYLIEHKLPIDKTRATRDMAGVNKKLALTVVKYYQ